MTRIIAIAKKEIIQILRDPLSLTIAFLIPVLLLFLFGYAITFDINNIKTVVYDNDKSPLSRRLISTFEESRYFSVISYAENYKKITEALSSNNARVAVIIPYDFSRDIKAKRQAKLQVIIDGSDSNTANVAGGYIAAAMDVFYQKLGAGKKAPVIDIRPRVWFNPELRSKNFVVPGLIAVIMAVISALLTSLTISREWERGTMEQLISTPVKNHEIILGKIVPYFVIGFMDICIALFVGIVIFKAPLKGNIWFVFGVSSIFLFGALSWGIFVSTVARSQILASQISIISTFLPAILLSGFMFSISNMPQIIQAVSYAFPARYFVKVLKAVFLKGAGADFLVFEILLLIFYGALIFTLANKKFKRVVE